MLLCPTGRLVEWRMPRKNRTSPWRISSSVRTGTVWTMLCRLSSAVTGIRWYRIRTDVWSVVLTSACTAHREGSVCLPAALLSGHRREVLRRLGENRKLEQAPPEEDHACLQQTARVFHKRRRETWVWLREYRFDMQPSEDSARRRHGQEDPLRREQRQVSQADVKRYVEKLIIEFVFCHKDWGGNCREIGTPHFLSYAEKLY